jgi:hypothetical protein
MNKPLALGLLAGIAGIASVLTLTLAGAGPLTSNEKPANPEVGTKGTPVPAPNPRTSADQWVVVPPEERTDIDFVDITEARLFLPERGDAANCDDGKLDPKKTETVVREWLVENRDRLPLSQVWDQTLIGVVCQYPSSDYPGKLQLNIGFQHVGYSYLAPESCAEQMAGLPAEEATLPPDCLMPDDLAPTPEAWSYTVSVDPSEVLE